MFHSKAQKYGFYPIKLLFLQVIKQKVINKSLKIIWLTVVAIAAFLFAGTLAIQFPQVQTFIGSRLVSKLSEKLDGQITFEKVHLKPFTTLVLKNAAITEKNPKTDTDTLFRAEYIIATFTLDGLFRQEGIHLRRAFVDNAQMNLVLEDKEDSGDGDVKTDNLSRIFRLKKADPNKEKNMSEIFRIRKAEIRNMGFHMVNIQTGRHEYNYETGIDWNDLDVRNINIQARDLRFKEGKMSGIADKVSFIEKSGYECIQITGEAIVGGGKTIINNLSIKDRWSDVHLDLFMMSYANAKAFSEFLTDVKLDGQIRPSILDFNTISYFAPALNGNNLRANIQGIVSGYVSDFDINNVSISSEAGGFAGTVNGRMTGLPDVDQTSLTANVQNFFITSKGLGLFVSEWMPEGNLDLSGFCKETDFHLDADVKGKLDSMAINAVVNSQDGSLSTDASLSGIISKDSPITISGALTTNDLDFGKMIGTDIIHHTTLKARLKAQIGDKKTRSFMKIDSLIVDRLHLNGYDYSGIAGAGTLAEEAFNGTIICNDPSLNFMFQGAFALSPKTHNSRYDFYAVVGHADLNAMNLDKRGISEIQFQTKADFTRTRVGDIFGKIDVADVIARNDQGRHDIGNINLTSHITTNNIFRARLNSRFADASYTGSATITKFLKDLRDITLKKEMPAMFEDPSFEWSGNSYEVNMKFHNSMNLLAFAMPGFYIADSTAFNVNISKEGSLNAKLKSSRIAFKEQYLKGFNASFDNIDNSLHGDLSCKEVMVAGLKLEDNSFRILADDNHIGAGYRYQNDDELINQGEFVMIGDVSRPDNEVELEINILPSTLYLNSNEWNIQQSKLSLRKEEVNVSNLEITSGEQHIKMKGRASATDKDTLTLNLDRFNLAILNSVMKTDMRINGAVSGQAQLTSPLESKGLLADLICDSVYVADVPLGVLNIGSSWDEDFERFNIAIRNSIEGRRSIDAAGKLTPRLKTIEADITLDRLNVGYAQPLLADIFSKMDGSISGDIRIDGPLDRFSISSNGTRLDDAMLTVAYTNVPYYADGAFHIDDEGVYFDDINIRDRYDGNGLVTGGILFDHFRDIRFDTRIRANNIECVDLSEKQADTFYGNLSATGNVAISGPVNSILMSIDAVTSREGQFHIPLSNVAGTAGSNNLLKFKEPEKFVYIDPYETMISRLKIKEASKNDFGVKLKVNASPSVEAFVEIDKASGNVLSGRGSGTIDLEISNDVFNINGDYTLNSGSYHFKAGNIASRDFQIQDGSSIRFNGDIMESTLDINAVYRTKTSLSTLISDTTSVSNRRTVDCGIGITDKLKNPRLKFSIEIPDLDPTIKSRVESALSSEDKVQRQFLSLIITNSFLPDEQSGIVNNSSMLYSTATEIMANQLNSIFQKLDIPLDLGMNYQPNERGNDIFDVAVTTQLFNNRVVVNGNIGNKQRASSTQNDVVGDLDIEIKLDRSGAFRLNLFSHSADQYTNFLDNSQRNGVGLTYQTEFNSFRKFIKNMFLGKKKRREAKLAEEEAMISGGRNIIEIKKTTYNE